MYKGQVVPVPYMRQPHIKEKIGGDEMKRYNVHLDPEWIKALDEIRQAITDSRSEGYSFYGLNRSQLIRFAIGYCFNLKEQYQLHDRESLMRAIKKVLKKRVGRKCV